MGTIPSTEPLQIRAGDTAKWTKLFDDYPAGSWALSYVLKNSEQSITVDSGDITTDGDQFMIEIPATETAGWAAGDYTLVAILTQSDDRATFMVGLLSILPDMASGEPFDGRTQNEKILATIRAILADPDDVGEYTIAGRQVKKRDLYELEQRYAWRVLRERNQAALFYGASFNR